MSDQICFSTPNFSGIIVGSVLLTLIIVAVIIIPVILCCIIPMFRKKKMSAEMPRDNLNHSNPTITGNGSFRVNGSLGKRTGGVKRAGSFTQDGSFKLRGSLKHRGSFKRNSSIQRSDSINVRRDSFQMHQKSAPIKYWGLPNKLRSLVLKADCNPKYVAEVGVEYGDDLGFSLAADRGGIFVKNVNHDLDLNHLKNMEHGELVLGLTVSFQSVPLDDVLALISLAAAHQSTLYIRKDAQYDLLGLEGHLIPTMKSGDSWTEGGSVHEKLRVQSNHHGTRATILQSMPPFKEKSMNGMHDDDAADIEDERQRSLRVTTYFKVNHHFVRSRSGWSPSDDNKNPMNPVYRNSPPLSSPNEMDIGPRSTENPLYGSDSVEHFNELHNHQPMKDYPKISPQPLKDYPQLSPFSDKFQPQKDYPPQSPFSENFNPQKDYPLSSPNPEIPIPQKDYPEPSGVKSSFPNPSTLKKRRRRSIDMSSSDSDADKSKHQKSPTTILAHPKSISFAPTPTIHTDENDSDIEDKRQSSRF